MTPTICAFHLGFSLGLTHQFTNEEWRPSEVKTFSLTGPYVGPVTIWSTGSRTVTNTTTPNISCQQYQRYTIEKGSGNVPLYVKRCDAEEKTKIRFFIAHPYKCEPGQHVQKTFQFHIQDVVENQVQIIEPNHAEPIDTDETETDTTPAEPLRPVRPNIETAGPGCNTEGALDTSDEIIWGRAEQGGPRHISLIWESDSSGGAFCVNITDLNPHNLPPEVGQLPENGILLNSHETFKGLGGNGGWSHWAQIGGDDFDGLAPGRIYRVTIQHIERNGNYGPVLDAGVITTNPLEQLGPVVNPIVTDSVRSILGRVGVSWHRGAGHGDYLDLEAGETVTVEWRLEPEDYSAERVVEPHRCTSSQACGPRYSTGVSDLEPDTVYVFRITPKAPNLADGQATEITFRTRAPSAPPALELREAYFSRISLKLKVVSYAGIEQMKVYVQSGADERVITTDGGVFDWLADVHIPFWGRENCITVAGISGTGAAAIEGDQSNEICVTHERPDEPQSRAVQQIVDVVPQ